MSKYLRLDSSRFSVNLVYVPKFPDSFQAKYEQLVGKTATTDVLRYCKHELIHLVWSLLLNNPRFVDVYLNGMLEHCADRILRLLFPRLFTHSADYIEKVLLASIKFLSERLCMFCLIKKEHIEELGTLANKRRMERTRQDTPVWRKRIETIWRSIYEKGTSFSSKSVTRRLAGTSEHPDRNAFSESLHQTGNNFYNLFVADLMHKITGIIESIFKHLNRIIYQEDKLNTEILNKRFRSVPAFDSRTIRLFINNVTEMRKFACRDFEDLIQCAIPCYEGLLPPDHNDIVLDLLWDLNVVIAYASLHLHSDSTLASLNTMVTELGNLMRRFVNDTCTAYVTTEIPEEAEKRRHSAARARKKKNKQPKKKRKRDEEEEELLSKEFNMSTFKIHNLEHYVHFIKNVGSFDGVSTRPGE
ncbi:hypothetical protein E1B28_007188 [Marasmius oreades]|uniref:Uncharacterized protein n=1 Tax=Marasmius oreades TaxID=181124 RepID=A0A9P7UVM1_9AGAR|nr:uncharacterized protein E1B28_007188 [Marasmius oreades]KAG7093514.1 hypothetical protein E1B28_007188 [Marasmius oreades]